MNVAELIEKLKALPQDLPVVLDAEEYGQSAPIFVGEVFALKALEESNWFGEYLCDEDPERLVLRVATVPEFPDNPVPVKVVTLSCRDSYVDQSPTLAQELEQVERLHDEISTHANCKTCGQEIYKDLTHCKGCQNIIQALSCDVEETGRLHNYALIPFKFRVYQPEAGRPHKLAWSGKEWVAPCGCAYHPDDDKNTHGGAPHVHLCEGHEARQTGT